MKAEVGPEKFEGGQHGGFFKLIQGGGKRRGTEESTKVIGENKQSWLVGSKGTS